MPTRRQFLAAGGAILGSLALPHILERVWAGERSPGQRRTDADEAGVIKILMQSDQTGANVGFDPIGIHIQPGQKVSWLITGNVHTTTAYHPRNNNHSLRIPEAARPWDSGYLVNPGDHFELTLMIEGVYDYYCIPHEMAGMVGRIIVGKPTGPGSMPFDYFHGKPGAQAWVPVPEAARKAFPSIEQIMREKIVHRR
jgi:plastocyanin